MINADMVTDWEQDEEFKNVYHSKEHNVHKVYYGYGQYYLFSDEDYDPNKLRQKENLDKQIKEIEQKKQKFDLDVEEKEELENDINILKEKKDKIDNELKEKSIEENKDKPEKTISKIPSDVPEDIKNEFMNDPNVESKNFQEWLDENHPEVYNDIYGKEKDEEITKTYSPMSEYSVDETGLTDEQKDYWDNSDDEFKYMMLGRMQSDNEYYLGNGNRNTKDLWANDEEAQINNMRYIYNSLKEKPEWLTEEDINNYEKKMLGNEEIKPDKVWDDDEFVQTVDMDGSEITYNKDELEKMEKNKVKPMKNSYTGRGWEGTNYDSTLSTKEIAKNVNDYMKKEFPDVKMSRKTDYSSINITITESDKDLYLTDNEINNMSDDEVFDILHNGQNMFFDRWAEDNVSGYKNNRTFTAKDVKDYMKEDVNRLRNHPSSMINGNEYYLSNYGKNVVSNLNKELNSYNYDDDDGSIDYFNSNFYSFVKIGSYDKPYKSND